MAKKIKQKSTLKSWEDVDNALFQIGEAKAFIEEQEADMNREMQTITTRYEEATKDSVQRKLALEKDIELFCLENKKEFEKQRTKSLPHGKVGFRFGKYSLKTLSKEWNSKKVIDMVKKLFGNKYINENPTINKQKLIADATAKTKLISASDLAEVGLKLQQNEIFFCEPTWEELEELLKSKAS